MSPLAPYRKAVGTLITGLIAGLTWIIGTGADPRDWRTWAQFALFLLIAAGTYFSPANADSGPATGGQIDTASLAEQIAAFVTKALAAVVHTTPVVTVATAPVVGNPGASVNTWPPTVGEIAEPAPTVIAPDGSGPAVTAPNMQ